MKTLEHIKEEYAIVYCQYPSWGDFINDIPNHDVESHMNEVAEIYATEYAKEALRLASENATIVNKFGNDIGSYTFDNIGYKVWINKQSILSDYNLPKHR